MSQSSEPSEALRAFKEASLQGFEAFNRHDFNSAFALLPPDIEWHPFDEFPGAHVLRGRAAVTEFFREVAADFPDFRSARYEFSEPAPGVFIVRFENQGTGRVSEVSVTSQVVHQVWEIARDPWRVREYRELNDALEAVKLRDAE